MSQIVVKEGNLINYTNSLIKFAVYNYPNQIVELLESKGVVVPQNVSLVTLHAMTLKAMTESDSFKVGLTQLLHSIVMNDLYSNYENNGYANQDGAITAPASGSTCSSCCQSWLGQTLNPKTVDNLLTSGVTLFSSSLKSDSQIKNAVTPIAPQQAATTNWLMWGCIAGAVVGGIWYWQVKKKGKKIV